MADEQAQSAPLTVDQFAEKIKAKYPTYAQVPNQMLAKKVLDKYPDYWNKVDAGDFQKKGMWQPASTGTKVDGAPVRTAPTAAGKFMDKAAPKVLGAAPAVLGTAGGIVGGALAAPVGAAPGAVIGAAVGGGLGEALKEKVSGQKVSAHDVAKSTAEQTAWETLGGAFNITGKGITKLAKSVGLDEAMMKFALKTGEDIKNGVNPAEAFGKWKMQAMAIKDLYAKVGTQADKLLQAKNTIIDKALPTSQQVRPYAVIKAVLDKHIDKSEKVLDPEIKNGMQKMLKSLQDQFTPKAQPGPGSSYIQSLINKEWQGRSETLMSIKDADKLKSLFGESVNWGKKAADNKLEDVYKAEVSVRREIYGALNSSIKDAAGTHGRALAETQKDLHNVLEAKRLLEESAAGQQVHGRHLMEMAVDAVRRPGPMSVGAAAVRGAGPIISKTGQGAVTGARLLSGATSGLPTAGPENTSQSPK
jgi:hypothetical protein